MLDIVLQGEKVKLLAERAMYWPAQKMLIVADLHWGKSAHFRKNGIAIPGNTQTQDEVKLARLVRGYNIEQLVIAGDMFHSRHNKEVDIFSHWRNAHQSLHIDLVTGNHDVLPEEKYKGWGLQVHDQLKAGPFLIVHDVPADCTDFCIHGHVHPAIRISRRGHNSIRLCCFCEDENRFILPAFGAFTGNHILEPSEHKHVYVIADEAVMQWS